MALVLKRMFAGYFWLFDEQTDPRVKDYILLSSPVIPFAIVTSFLYFIYEAGPQLMLHRKPFDLKKVLIVYNLSQIVFNLMLLVPGLKALTYMNSDCNLIDYTESPKGKLFLKLTYLYYLLKVYDLVDTIIIVLRKNMRKITFLHVYHHCGMVMGSFAAAIFLPGGELFWTGFINAIVHSVMYTYYLASTLDNKWKEPLTAKKFLTQLQLVQFVINVIIYGRLIFKQDCEFPIIIPIIYVPQNVFMLALFGDFYIKTYLRDNSGKTKMN